MKIYLDRMTEKETALEVDRFYENLNPEGQSLSAERTYTYGKETTPTPQSYAGLAGKTFEAIEAESDAGEPIPISGSYKRIELVSTSFAEASQMYTVSIQFA